MKNIAELIKLHKVIRKSWWKILAVVLMFYTFIGGFLVKVPYVGNLYETIRNSFFHIPMWIAMMILFTVSVVYAIKYLRNPTTNADIYSAEYARSGIVFGILGLTTGAVWARYTWGEFWSNDPKQLLAAIALLIYAAYFILRSSVTDMDKRAKLGAVYNIFAFAMLFPTLWIIPRIVESLHPGGQGVEGNPGMNGRDLAPQMLYIIRPAFLGWTLLGVWITTLRIRFAQLNEKKLSNV